MASPLRLIAALLLVAAIIAAGTVRTNAATPVVHVDTDEKTKARACQRVD
jgi:hypothetical protein